MCCESITGCGFTTNPMSSRAVEMLKEDMEASGPVRGKDVMHAQQEAVTLLRKLEAEGKVILKVEDDDEFVV